MPRLSAPESFFSSSTMLTPGLDRRIRPHRNGDVFPEQAGDRRELRMGGSLANDVVGQQAARSDSNCMAVGLLVEVAVQDSASASSPVAHGDRYFDEAVFLPDLLQRARGAVRPAARRAVRRNFHCSAGHPRRLSGCINPGKRQQHNDGDARQNRPDAKSSGHSFSSIKECGEPNVPSREKSSSCDRGVAGERKALGCQEPSTLGS